MNISSRAASGIQQPDIPKKEQPLSEQFRLAGNDWVDKEAAARLLEEMKTTTLAQLMSKHITVHGPMAANKCEMEVKASKEWEQYILQMCNARTEAQRARIVLEWTKMKFTEWQAADATTRAEMKMTRS